MSNRSTSGHPLKCLVVLALVAVGCGGGQSSVESVELVGANEEVATSASALTTCVTANSTLQTTTSLNLRTGPATTYGIIVTMPANSLVIEWGGGCPTSGWYKVYYGGVTGWASGTYLNQVTSSYSSRDESLARSEGVVGFSYWWGHGAWNPGAAAGSCSGSCPSCTHSGSYGGDCSGFVAKAWVVPSTNSNVAADSHPYSTVNFNVDSSQWYTVDRGTVLKADAMVYNDGSGGHIFIYESGDGWGSMYAYECKGCVDGCVYDLRTASTAYHAIRHY
ncbi:MAG: SH3 domain-containing protein [Archangium sp.]